MGIFETVLQAKDHVAGLVNILADDHKDDFLAGLQHSPITWVQVGEWSDRHEASKHFEIGDEISDTLKTGEEVVFVVAVSLALKASVAMVCA